MQAGRERAARLLVVAVILYSLLLGGTFNGMINLTINRATLVLLSIGVAFWLGLRWLRKWQWSSSPFDRVLLAGLVAVVIAVLPNLESWRRMAIGLWYWGLFLGCWLVLSDLVANGMPTRWLADGILATGVPVLFFGYWQVRGWLVEWMRLAAAGIPVPFVPLRPGSIIGNPNALGSVLIVVVLLAVGRIVQEQRLLFRLGWAAYLLLCAGLLFLTLSRGAWLGLVVGWLGWLGLLVWRRGLTSLPAWRAWWRALERGQRALILGGVGVMILAGVLLLPAAWRAVSQPGRTPETRQVIWDAALAEFMAHPLTGTGPFTFGRGLLLHQSTPPRTPHSHAHNLILHVGAEAGVPGLLVLLWGAVVAGRAWVQRWHAAREARPTMDVAAAGVALAALLTHQLLDMTVMMASVALLGIMLLVMATGNAHAQSSVQVGARHWRGAVVAGLWALLLVTGWWSYGVRAGYLDGLLMASRGEWRLGAERLAQAVAQDPAMPLYPAQRGYVLGVAAARGDDSALAEAVASWERALALEDVYAPWWANLAALRWQAGDTTAAVRDLQEAIARAPESPTLWLNLGRYHEVAGDRDAAQNAYVEALGLHPAWRRDPFWQETALRQQALAAFEAERGAASSSVDRALALLYAGDASGARDALLADPLTASPYAARRVILALACEQVGLSGQADLWLASAQLYPHAPDDDAWMAVGQVGLAIWRGDPRAEQWVAQAEALLYPTGRGSGFPGGENLAWFHFLREAFPQQLLPQLLTLPESPAAAALLEWITRP